MNVYFIKNNLPVVKKKRRKAKWTIKSLTIFVSPSFAGWPLKHLFLFFETSYLVFDKLTQRAKTYDF